MSVQMLSIAYAFVMLAVLVATTSQIVLESAFPHYSSFLIQKLQESLFYRCVYAPTSLFIVGMVLIFAGAALLHPQVKRGSRRR